MLALVVAVAAPVDGKTMGVDDWQAMTVLAVGSGSHGSPYYLRVAAGDLDGDGLAYEAYLKLDCANGVLKQASYIVKRPRRSATGMATGKRMHKPFTVVKEWVPEPPAPALCDRHITSRKMEGARSAVDDWTGLSLSKADCVPQLTLQLSASGQVEHHQQLSAILPVELGPLSIHCTR
jgi:hypothetical protein